MWNKAVSFLVACLLMWALVGHAEELTPEQQAAKEHGIALYNQYKALSATPFLETAAEAGDPEAQFYLGEALRRSNRFITPESQQWLEAAANQGYVWAMIRLVRSGGNLCAVVSQCPQGSKTAKEWLQQAYDVTLPLGERGDPEALYQLFKITGDPEWRTKAAEAGHAEAQYWHAAFTKEGFGFYWWPGSRKQEVEKWFKASAEGGYPVAMEQYAGLLLDKGDSKGYHYWIEKAAKRSHASSLFSYALIFIERFQEHGKEDDLIKGYGLISLLLELDGGGSLNKSVAEWELARIAKETKITPEQIEQAQASAAEWKASHPLPLSFFPHILDPLDN